MKQKRRRFTAEFKAEALRLVRRKDRPVSVVARELGVHAEVLRSWVRRAQEQSDAVPEPAESIEAENRRLRRENARLQEERDILKKAAVYFATESR